MRRRCRLRRSPARAPRDAPPGAPVSPLVRALLRSVRAHCSAPRRAVVFAQVRTFPPALPPTCCARPRAAPAALPARSSAAAAPMRRCRRPRFPELRCCSTGRPDRRGGLGSHTRRIVDAQVAVAAHGREQLVMPRALAPLSAPGMPETPATDRCSQTTPGRAVPAPPSHPCRAEHLSGFHRVAPYSLENSSKHL